MPNAFDMNELELKFEVPPQTLRSLQSEFGRRGARSLRMQACYFDTPDGLLARNGMSLRLRKEGRRWVQTLKAQGNSVVNRLEHNVALRVAAGSRPALDPARHNGSEAGVSLHRALAGADTGGLLERYATDFLRRVCVLETPDGSVEAALDLGAIRAGKRESPICELELEFKSGDPHALFELAKTWGNYGGMWLNTRSKSARGALLAQGCEHGPAELASSPEFQDGASGNALLRAVMRSALDQVLANASETASGSTCDETIHQLRVGLRRLRTALRDLGPLGEGVDPAWETSLSRTFSLLGEVRDNESVALAVRPLLEKAAAPKLQWDAAGTQVDPGAAVRDAGFQATLLDLLGFALRPDADSAPGIPSAQVRQKVIEHLGGLHAHIVRAGKHFEELAPEVQHKVRKRLKRLRYLAEFVQAMWGKKAVDRYLKQLRPAQDALGHHHDVAVAAENFRQDAQRDPTALFAAGYLQAYLATTARAARTALKPVASAPRFWKR